MSDTKLRIVFMGTPDFAVASLDILVQNGYNIVGVVTSPDKPAGRGLEVQQSAVKKYALKKKLNVLQPEKLKSENFLNELKALKADLQIVVAFRMLPEIVWQMPHLGTFNLHASLLPQYRGAAPINWAVMNGESETGVTTFFLKHEIDTGKIIYREKVGISENESAGELHDKLMNVGAQLVLKTVQSIETGTYKEIEQDQFLKQDEVLKHAPKIFKNDCKIDWNLSIDQIHNKIRGLSPYPAAFTELVSPEGKMFSVKLFKTTKETDKPTTPIVSVSSDSKSYIKVSVKEGYICLHELQLAGKKRMNVTEFLRGFPLTNGWKVQ
jgi:methionyl-tRNA formyltransferase